MEVMVSLNYMVSFASCLAFVCTLDISSGTSGYTGHNQPTDCPPLLETPACILGTGLRLWLEWNRICS